MPGLVRLLERPEKLPWSNNQISLRNCMNNISAAHNTYELTIIYDWNPFDLAISEEHGNLANRCLFTDENNLVAHDVSDTQPFPINFANDIGFRDDTDDFAIFVDNG